MKYCFGTVAWGGYLEKYVDIFVNNYITLYRRLINLGINYEDIADPRIVYCEDKQGQKVVAASKRLTASTGKKLKLICDRHHWTVEEIMYSTRNRLRSAFREAYPEDKKVYFYFPIDDHIRPAIDVELYKLSKLSTPNAVMFKFLVEEGIEKYTAGTRPICSYKDIHSSDWGGYCAYNILDEDKCPLYPEIAIPNVAFYVALYQAGYKEYSSSDICIDHLRHPDSHHFKYKDTKMSQDVTDYLLAKRKELCKKGFK